MSVYRTEYLIYGYKDISKFPNSKDIDTWDDKYLPYIEGHDGEDFAMVVDRMAGHYIVFGDCFERIDTSYGSCECFEFQNLEQYNLNADKVKEKYNKVFGEDVNLPEPEFFIFTHIY